jgi:DNA modification methylase
MGATFHEDNTARLIHGDALELAQFIEPESVDLIVTSPPYFALRSYKDGDEHYDGQIGDEDTPQQFLEALWAVTAECQRVLKPGGSLFVNLGDKYSRGSRPRSQPDQFRTTEAITYNDPKYVIDSRTDATGVLPKSLMGLPWRYAIGCTDGMAGDEWVLRSEIIWSKPNGLPESVKDRVRRSHETWFHLTRQPTYFSGIDEIREPHQESSLKRAQPHRANVLAHEDSHEVDMTQACHPLGKLPGSVWTVPLEPLRVPDWLGVEHFAAFPQEWPRRIIKGWTPTGFCVECKQARTPTTDVTRTLGAFSAYGAGRHGNGSKTLRSTNPVATITGYACGCDNTNAPTTPAVVLDPFCGTGTVPMVARALGRYGIGVDLSNDYLKLAKWRVWESGHATKSIRRNNLEAQTELFGDI